MNDARSAFHELHVLASAAYETSPLAEDTALTERRISRDRTRRFALTSTIGAAAAAGVLMAAINIPWMGQASPAKTPAPSASPHVTSTSGATPEWCHVATVVPGKPVGDLMGFEGWFNGTPDAPCDGWDEEIKAHPDTVWINTIDNTMIEAYFRTSIDALGPYGDLPEGAVVASPDPAWPADSSVLIDARTGEILSTQRFADMDNFDIETGHFNSVEPDYP
jgi:hypothetical protein